jgi:NADH:ubiquinone oxidoreductase subunit C
VTAPEVFAQSLDERGWVVPAPIEHPMSGVTESRWIAPAHLVAAAEAAKAADYFLESLTCVDRLEALGGFELIYTFNRWDAPARVAYRVLAARDQAAPSLTGVYRIAEWNEREAWELFGVGFAGHPHLRCLLLPEGTEFHPLLKSFTAPPPSIYDDSLSAPVPQDEHRDPGARG